MKIHLYAQCRNDEWMLPYFFRHYDPLVDHYFLYDDESTDRTVAIVRGHPRTTLRTFPRSPDSFVLSEQSLSNTGWQESRGEADWVIVTDIDEHLYHPRFRGYLSDCIQSGVTIVPALGYQMISESLPDPAALLAESLTMGAPWVRMMKISVFDPTAITAINYSLGRHAAAPVGRVQAPRIDELVLLHFKYIGFRRTYLRHQDLLRSLGSVDHDSGWGHKYSWTEGRLREDWDGVAARAIDTSVVRDAPDRTYPYRPWWDCYRSPHG